jgi:hypothetical protein
MYEALEPRESVSSASCLGCCVYQANVSVQVVGCRRHCSNGSATRWINMLPPSRSGQRPRSKIRLQIVQTLHNEPFPSYGREPMQLGKVVITALGRFD